MNQKIGIIIPVYLHSGKLPELLDQLNVYVSMEDVLVVDDGSPEASALTATAFGAHTIHHSENQGKGAALQKGLEYWGIRGYDWVITLDADGQHDPAEIPKFRKAIEADQYDVIIGSRLHDLSSMPLDRQFSNRTTSRLISRLTGKYIHDSQSGYRAIRLASVAGINWYEPGFAFESEMIVRLAKRDARLHFIPIRSIYPKGQKSSIKRLPDTLRFLRAVARSLLFP